MEPEKRTTTALLYLDGINVSFDGFRALNNLSLSVEPGEMRAIIGPNGAGKTTMMDVVTGKTRPDTGDVFFEGGAHDLSKLDEDPNRDARHRPQVSEADGVRHAHRRGQSLPGAQERPSSARHRALGRDGRRAGPASLASSTPSGSARCVRAPPGASRTARSNGWKSACCWRRSRSSSWSMSRSPA